MKATSYQTHYVATDTSSSLREPSAGVWWSRTDCLHVGQEERDSNHVSMHFTWKPWLHLGKTLTFSPSTNSPKQIKHSVAFILSSELYESTGIRFNSRFLIPFATFASIESSLGVSLLVQRKTQRVTEFRPRAQIRANIRAANTITMFVSNLAIFILLLLLEPPKVASVAEIVGVTCGSSRNLAICKRFKNTAEILFNSPSKISLFFLLLQFVFKSDCKRGREERFELLHVLIKRRPTKSFLDKSIEIYHIYQSWKSFW